MVFETFSIMASALAPAQVRAFALLGDSNIHRHINKTSCRALDGKKVNSNEGVPCLILKRLQEAFKCRKWPWQPREYYTIKALSV